MAKRILVIGGGPAGMMAAIRASESGHEVILAEKNNTLGKKLLLSGKGRCNLTNACGLDEFLRRFSKNGAFLRDAFKVFFNCDLMNFFRQRGLELKVERQERVFPVTDSSASILKVLKDEISKRKIEVIYNQSARSVVVKDGKVRAVKFATGSMDEADCVIMATGGVSYAFTGSTGEGLNMAGKLGHRIVNLRPGLVGLETKQVFEGSLAGLTLKNIRLKFSDGRKKLVSDIGELLFTESGISGPLVLSVSGKIGDWLAEGADISAIIDLKPALSIEALDLRLLGEFEQSPKKSIKKVLKNLLPQKLINIFLYLAQIPESKKAAQLRQEERKSIVFLLKNFRLDILKPRPIKEAMVTRGGVSLNDVDPRTMQSRKVKGLYFAGEMLDIDADTGGFNLQAAFSTGYLAGQSAAKSL